MKKLLIVTTTLSAILLTSACSVGPRYVNRTVVHTDKETGDVFTDTQRGFVILDPWESTPDRAKAGRTAALTSPEVERMYIENDLLRYGKLPTRSTRFVGTLSNTSSEDGTVEIQLTNALTGKPFPVESLSRGEEKRVSVPGGNYNGRCREKGRSTWSQPFDIPVHKHGWWGECHLTD